MNQIPQIRQNVALPFVTTGRLPGSTEIYVPGVFHPDLMVLMRKIAAQPFAGEPPGTVYDTSGTYTNPAIVTDIAQG